MTSWQHLCNIKRNGLAVVRVIYIFLIEFVKITTVFCFCFYILIPGKQIISSLLQVNFFLLSLITLIFPKKNFFSHHN